MCNGELALYNPDATDASGRSAAVPAPPVPANRRQDPARSGPVNSHVATGADGGWWCQTTGANANGPPPPAKSGGQPRAAEPHARFGEGVPGATDALRRYAPGVHFHTPVSGSTRSPERAFSAESSLLSVAPSVNGVPARCCSAYVEGQPLPEALPTVNCKRAPSVETLLLCHSARSPSTRQRGPDTPSTGVASAVSNPEVQATPGWRRLCPLRPLALGEVEQGASGGALVAIPRRR